MAELIQASVAVFAGASSAASEALARRIDAGDVRSVTAAVDVAVPVLTEAMGRRLAGPDGGQQLAELIGGIDPSGLADPGNAIASGGYTVAGRRLVGHLLDGPERGRAAQTIADRAGLGAAAGAEVLTAAAWAVGAQLRHRVATPVDVGALAAVLDPGSAEPRQTRPPLMIPTTALAPVVSEPDETAVYRPVPPRPAPRAPIRTATERAPVRPVAERPIGVDDSSGWSSPLVVGAAAALGLLVLAGALWWLLDRGEDDAVTSAVLDDSTVGDDQGNTTGSPTDEASTDDPVEGVDDVDGGDDTTGSDAGEDGSSEGDPADGSGQRSGEAIVAAGERIELAMIDPIGRSDATGVAGLRFDRATSEVCYDLTLDGVATPADGHIHLGPAGVKGGIVIDFGPMDDGVSGCQPVPGAEFEAIVADLDGHYVELHDPIDDFTIRAQLSEGIGPDGQAIAPAGAGGAASTGSDESVLFDPDGGGAIATVEPGRIVLEGQVADRETAERVLIDFAGLSEVLVVDELEVVEGSPLPSGRVIIDAPETGLFASDSDELDPDVDPLIDQLVGLLGARPDWQVTVVGHTDSTGNEVTNLELSFRRAEAVRQELIAAGVAPDRIRVRGAGSTDPLGNNNTTAGRAQNRRIEFEIDR